MTPLTCNKCKFAALIKVWRPGKVWDEVDAMCRRYPTEVKVRRDHTCGEYKQGRPPEEVDEAESHRRKMEYAKFLLSMNLGNTPEQE